MSRIHIAIASTRSLPGCVEQNLKQIEGFARRAGEEGVHLLLTPELSASGYGSYPEVFQTSEPAGGGPISEALMRQAERTGVVIAAGFSESAKEEGKAFISQMVAFPDGTFVVQRKHLIAPAEKPFLPAGETGGLRPFEVQGVRCAISICADAGMPERERWFEEEKIDLGLLPTGAGGRREDRVTTRDLLTKKGQTTYERVLRTVFLPDFSIRDCLGGRRSVAAVNLTGYDGRRHYHCGHGTITNQFGEVVAFFPGQPILDRQRPMYARAWIDTDGSMQV